MENRLHGARYGRIGRSDDVNRPGTHADRDDLCDHCDEHKNHFGRHFVNAWDISWQCDDRDDLWDHRDEHRNHVGRHLFDARHTLWQHNEHLLGGDDLCDDLNEQFFNDHHGDDFTDDCDGHFLDGDDISDDHDGLLFNDCRCNGIFDGRDACAVKNNSANTGLEMFAKVAEQTDDDDDKSYVQFGKYLEFGSDKGSMSHTTIVEFLHGHLLHDRRPLRRRLHS